MQPSIDLMQEALPCGYRVRPATMADAEDVARVFNACSVEVLGVADYSAEQFRNDWRLPGFELATDTRAVLSPQGELIAYGDLWGTSATFVRLTSWVRVHPDYRGRGIGTYLGKWVEARAREDIGKAPPGARVVLTTWIPSADRRARELLAALGMVAATCSREMHVDLEKEPPAPHWPDGITVSAKEAGDEREFYRARCEAFRDHRGYVEEPFEDGLARWRHVVETEQYYDPSLWFKALDGDRIAGFAIGMAGTVEDPGMAWVDSLAVLRPYRRRGVGFALLRHCFCEFYRRGLRRAGLSVDAESLTGATRLYERAGMRVVREHVGYERELRSGVELRTKSVGG